MSFEKFILGAENDSEPAKIRFYYLTDKIFNSVSLRTTYRANMIKTADGESQLDDIAISQDERDIMLEFLADAIYEISAEIFKITEGIDMSVFVDSLKYNAIPGGLSPFKDANHTDAEVIPVAPVLGTVYHVTTAWGDFSIDDIVVCTNADTPTFEKLNVIASGSEIRDNAAFNENLLPSIDKKMEACIRYYIMKEWYGSTGLQTDMQLNQGLYKQNLIKMKNLTFQLRKPLMS